MRSVPLSKVLPVLVIAATLTSPAPACINGDQLHPAKTGGKVFKNAPIMEPKPLLTPPPIALTLPGIAPKAATPDSAALSPFSLYVADFEANRMSPVNRTFGKRIDYTVALIRLGRAAEAIVELQSIEQAFPDRYATAANLGTAYELEGKLEDALTWIARGIARNPDSHDGTEWLHVAILKAKLKLKADPAWLAQHSVLDEADTRSASAVVLAIEYQLNERLVFVQPEDAVVCDLFYQAARRLDLKQPGMTERRTQYLQSSLRFGAWRKSEVEQALKS